MIGPSSINLELTSRCNKSCWMCGRRKIEREHPELCDWGDMPMEMVREIADQVSSGTVIQFHNNGEPLLYPQLDEVLSLFPQQIRCFNTNGKLLMERADEIIGNLETLTISVIQDDPEGDEQYETVCLFLARKTVRRFFDLKGDEKPFLLYRLLGRVENKARWEALPGLVVRRVLHAPGGSYNYQKNPTIPETGICLDLLTRLAIDRYGNISLCVRFDPEGDLRLGNISNMTIEQAWNSDKRQYYINWHIAQKREFLPGCNVCHYWGVPRG